MNFLVPKLIEVEYICQLVGVIAVKGPAGLGPVYRNNFNRLRTINQRKDCAEPPSSPQWIKVVVSSNSEHPDIRVHDGKLAVGVRKHEMESIDIGEGCGKPGLKSCTCAWYNIENEACLNDW